MIWILFHKKKTIRKKISYAQLKNVKLSYFHVVVVMNTGDSINNALSHTR